MNYTLFNPLSKNGLLYSTNAENSIDTTNTYLMNKLEQSIKPSDTITIIGGDGTLQYLIEHFPFILKYRIFYHKSGSGNDLYRALNKNIIYYYSINNTPFLNSFGIGFDALVCKNVNKSKNKGKLSYFKEAYLGLRNYKPISIEIEYNGQKKTFNKVWLCSLQNGNFFGGGINIARHANPHEKNIDLCIGHNLNMFKVMILLVFVKLGIVHLFKKYFFTTKVDSLKIVLDNKQLAQFDGNTKEINKEITLSINGTIDLEKMNVK